MFKLPQEYSIKLKTRILILRCLVFICLGVAAGAASYFGYTLLMHLENKLFSEQYDSLSDQIYKSILSSVNSKVLVSTGSANTFGLQCPDVIQWPNCSMRAQTYFDFLDSVSPENIREASIVPIVDPIDASAFDWRTLRNVRFTLHQYLRQTHRHDSELFTKQS